MDKTKKSKNDNAVGRADMALMSRLPVYTHPEDVPLTFVYGGRRTGGIGRAFRPETRRELIDANISRTTIVGRDEAGLEIRAECTEYRDFPAVEWVVYFTNTARRDTPVLSDILIGTTFEGTDPRFTRGNGDNCQPSGYETVTEALSAPVTLFPTDGTPCNGASPFMRLTFDGYGINIGIGWPAMWQACAAPAEDGAAFEVGQKRCNMYLKPGETIRTPRVSCLAFAGDAGRGRNMWRRWYMAHILPREHGRPLPPKLCLHTFMAAGKPEFTGADEVNQLTAIDDYLSAGYKPDIWWIDAGWYPCDFDWPATGTWTHNTKHFPRGLDPIGQKCDENDIQLLLWFEPERIRRGTELDTVHPEWALKRSEDDEGDRLLDLGNPECREWITNRVDALIKRYHVRVYRQDFNFAPLPVWEANEAEDRVGAMENAHVQGYLRFWDELIFRNPNLWIDSCASGGRRNEMETLRRAVPLHYTDVGYGHHPIKQKQHRYMFEWIPYFRAHTMNWDNDEGGYENGGKPVDLFAYHCALTPAVTSMVEHDAGPEIFAMARKFDPIWRRAADIMLSGDYYPLTECRRDPADWYAMQFDDPVRRLGFIQAVRNVAAPEESVTLSPRLDARLYKFENPETGERMSMTGDELREGFKISVPLRSGVIWFYEY